MDWDGYDFSLWGPSELKLSSWPHSWDLRDYPELQKKVDKALRLTVTAPDGMKGRRPVLIFFNGFLVRAAATGQRHADCAQISSRMTWTSTA